MSDEQVQELSRHLSGITYNEWVKLKMAIDEYFRIKTGEFERQLKLSNDDCMQQAIRSRFG